MEMLDAHLYIETLNHHTNQDVFEAAQDLIELIGHYKDQMECEYEIETKNYVENNQNMFSI